MKRIVSLTLAAILFAGPLISDDIFNVDSDLGENRTLKLKVSKSNEYKAKGTLDLGLGDNLLGDLKREVYEAIDESVEPLIIKLEELKEENMRNLNTSNLTGQDHHKTLGKSFMKMIGADGLTDSVKEFKEKNKGGIGPYLFGNEKFKASTSGLNPFADFNEDLKESVNDLKKSISEWNYLSDYMKENTKELQKDLDKYGKLDLETLATSLTKGDSSAEASFLTDLLSGKNPAESFDSYYKKAYPDFYPSKSAVSFTFDKSFPSTNNMCDITKCLIGGKCDDMPAGSQEDFEKKVEELRKALIQKAIYVMIKKLIYEFYIMEYIQFAQRAMACSAEASIATAMDVFGIVVPGMNTGAITGTSMGTTTAATNAQSSLDSSKETADCLRIDDSATKSEKNLDIKAAANAQGEQSTIYPFTSAYWVPYLGLGGGAKFQTDIPLKEYASTVNAKQCILEGKTSTWKNAFNMCMENGETSQIKFNASLQITIKDLFEKLRKHKKVQCELTKELSKSEKMNFSLLKYSELIPSLIKTDYNSGNSNSYFIEAVGELINTEVELNTMKTENQSCLDSVLYSKEQGVSKSCNMSVKDVSIGISSDSEMDSITNTVRDFCNATGKVIMESGKIKEQMDYEQKNKQSTFTDKIKPYISDLNFCSNYFKERFTSNKSVFTKVDYNDLLLETILEMKYRAEDESNFDKIIIDNYKETFNYMDTLSFSEKENICNNKNAYNSPNVYVKNSEEDSDEIYNNNYIESAIGKYCNAFKNEIINKELDKAFNDFDTPALDLSSVNSIIKDIAEEKVKYEKEGY